VIDGLQPRPLGRARRPLSPTNDTSVEGTNAETDATELWRIGFTRASDASEGDETNVSRDAGILAVARGAGPGVAVGGVAAAGAPGRSLTSVGLDAFLQERRGAPMAQGQASPPLRGGCAPPRSLRYSSAPSVRERCSDLRVHVVASPSPGPAPREVRRDAGSRHLIERVFVPSRQKRVCALDAPGIDRSPPTPQLREVRPQSRTPLGSPSVHCLAGDDFLTASLDLAVERGRAATRVAGDRVVARGQASPAQRAGCALGREKYRIRLYRWRTSRRGVARAFGTGAGLKPPGLARARGVPRGEASRRQRPGSALEASRSEVSTSFRRFEASKECTIPRYWDSSVTHEPSPPRRGQADAGPRAATRKPAAAENASPSFVLWSLWGFAAW
jgi:hypothetical protein